MCAGCLFIYVHRKSEREREREKEKRRTSKPLSFEKKDVLSKNGGVYFLPWELSTSDWRAIFPLLSSLYINGCQGEVTVLCIRH